MDTLEDIGDVSNVELIVKVLSSLSKVGHDVFMKIDGSSHEILGNVLHRLIESLQMTGKEGQVDGMERHGFG